MCLTAHGLIYKEGKNDRIAFDGYFLETPFSTCVNKLDAEKDEIELYYDSAMIRYLFRIRNIRISLPRQGYPALRRRRVRGNFTEDPSPDRSDPLLLRWSGTVHVNQLGLRC